MSDASSSQSGSSRREFLSRSIKAGLTVAAAGGVGAWLVRRAGRPPVDEAVSFADYRVASAGARMAVVEGDDRAALLQRGLTGVGGIGTFVEKGDRVLIKVNAAFASPPEQGATAHPALVGELVRLCLRGGARDVVVTDNPINDAAASFSLSGIGRAATDAGAKVVLPKQHYFHPITVPGGRLLRRWPALTEPLAGIDRVIGVSPVKDHFRAVASMSMKNWYGLLGGRRNRLHQDIHDTIKELAMMVRPTLVVLDGVTTMIDNGPTGGSPSDLKQTRRLIVSTDPVAADAYASRELLERRLADIPYIGKAEAAGCGTSDYASLLAAPLRL